jgi:GT2 family glycosyltransferase
MLQFSVIIPTCDRNDLLAKCLDCLAPGVQSLDIDHYEVIVSDDSKANTARSFVAEQYTWVKWVEGPKRGPAANRNNGARQASGGWLIFFDDDCLPSANCLNSYWEYISESDWLVLEGKVTSKEKIHSPILTVPFNEYGGNLWSCNFAIKKKTFVEIGMFDENYRFPNLEDNDLKKRIELKKIEIKFVPNADVDHPPRRLASPKKLARYHESWLYFHNKFGERKNLFNLVSTIIRHRVAAILRCRFSPDSIIACRNLVVELFFTFAFYTFPHASNNQKVL